MANPTGACCPAATVERLQAAFLHILPAIRTHAEIYFRGLRCPGRRDDAIAETVAVAWKWHLRLAERGKDAGQFAGALATLAARHVRSGRKLCGQERRKDVLSPLAQCQHGFAVQTLPAYETGTADNATLDALADNTVSPPPDQAAFRIDFPRWLSGLGSRNRRIAEDMAVGETTRELAALHRVSQGRISQLRREFHLDWRRFHGEAV